MPDWLQRARDAYSASTTWFDASIRLDIERDYKQFQGEHPPGSKYLDASYAARSRIFRPKTRATIRKNEAIWAEAGFSTRDVVAVAARNESDPVQRAGAELMQHLLQIRLTESIPWFLISCGAYQDAQKSGVVIGYFHWDYRPEKGIDRPLVKLKPPENFRLDPGADWEDPIGTSPYLCELIPMYVKDVKARMAQPDPMTGAPPWTAADATVIQSAVIPYDSLRQARQGRRMDPLKQGNAITDYTLVWIHRYIMEEQGEDFVFHTLGNNHLLDLPVPIGAVYHHGQRPYVMGVCNIETHKLYPGGVSRLTRDVQGEINETANLRIDNVKLALNKRFFVKRNGQVDTLSLTRAVPGAVTMMDNPEADVKIVDMPDVTSSAYAEQDRLNLDFDDISGAFSSSSVQSNRRLNETVGGMNLLTSNANQVSGYQLKTFVETFVEPGLRLLMALERAYETDADILSRAAQRADIAGKHGLDLIPDDLLGQAMTLSVNVGMGATNPADKINRFMTGMGQLRGLVQDGVLEKYGLNIREVIKELFGHLGYADGSRFFDQSDDPRLLAMRQELQQLRQALDQKVPPEMLAKQIEQLDAKIGEINAATVETGVRAAFSAMQAGQVIAQMPQVAPVADAVMQAAGYRAPNPPGQDPEFPAPAAPTVERFAPPMPGDTSPTTPASPEQGVARGIETLEADSA
jgi:hypothetical protein